MYKTKSLFNIRKFLTSKNVDDSSYIHASLSQEIYGGEINKKTKKKNKVKIDYYGNIRLTNCSRILDLDLSYYNKKEAKRKLKSLDLLIDTLIKFRKVYKKETEAYLKEKK